MRTVLLLALSLCAAPAIAQPDGDAQMFPAQPPVKAHPQQLWVAVPMADIERELKDFARRFGAPSLAVNSGYSRLFGAQPGSLQANQWARETQALLDGATLRVDKVRVLPPKRPATDATTRALVSYRFEFPEAVGAQDKLLWERPRQEMVQLRWQSLNSDPDKVVDLIDGEPFADYGWEMVAPAIPPPALKEQFYASGTDNFWENVAYHLVPEKVADTLAERSLAKLRQLTISAEWLAGEHGGRYAFTPDFMRAMQPYIRNIASFQIPGTNEFFMVNGQLNALNPAQIKEPKKTVLFYDGLGEQPIFRYDGRAAICFADGHAALVTPEEAKNLIWKP